jgi:predicted acetyltransferase
MRLLADEDRKPMTNEELRLVHPREDLREAYMDMVADFHTVDNHWPHGANENCDLALRDFAAYCRQMEDYRHGRNLPDGWVPASMFWCMAGERMMGTLSLRHELNDLLREAGGHIGYSIRPSERNKGYMTKFLRMGLEEARKVGLERVLITCADSNLASARVIEKCGGVLEDKRDTELHGDDLTRRYWIDLSA